ncbi:hypothetical protein B0H10DRAFT_1964100 [Mycena sp. CBHHK59/15]|nr:hypothetical protein B0H10DRAFT_1964100 [Mycena sp. CBHHK59/15]
MKEGDIVRFAAMVIIKDRLEIAIIITQNPYSACSRAVEGEMIKFADVVIIEGKDAIGSGFEVVSTNANAWFTFLIDRREDTVCVTQNPYGARSRAIETKMVKVAIPIVIEGEGPISSGFEVITRSAAAWIALLIDGHKSAVEYPINNKVIKFATVRIIHGEDLIGRGFEVVSSNAIAWITLVVDRAVEGEMIKFTTVVVIEGEGTIGCGSEVISTDANAWFTFLIDRREDTVIPCELVQAQTSPKKAEKGPESRQGHKVATQQAKRRQGNCQKTDAGAIEPKVIEFAAVVIVESEGEISGRSNIVSGNGDAWITLPVD